MSVYDLEAQGQNLRSNLHLIPGAHGKADRRNKDLPYWGDEGGTILKRGDQSLSQVPSVREPYRGGLGISKAHKDSKKENSYKEKPLSRKEKWTEGIWGKTLSNLKTKKGGKLYVVMK